MNVDDPFADDLKSLDAVMAQFSAAIQPQPSISTSLSTPPPPLPMPAVSDAPMEGRRGRRGVLPPAETPTPPPPPSTSSLRMPWEDEETPVPHTTDTTLDPTDTTPRAVDKTSHAMDKTAVFVEPLLGEWRAVRAAIAAAEAEETRLRAELDAQSVRAEAELLDLDTRRATAQTVLAEAEAACVESRTHSAPLCQTPHLSPARAAIRTAARDVLTARCAELRQALLSARGRVASLREQRALLLQTPTFDARGVRLALHAAGEGLDARLDAAAEVVRALFAARLAAASASVANCVRRETRCAAQRSHSSRAAAFVAAAAARQDAVAQCVADVADGARCLFGRRQKVTAARVAFLRERLRRAAMAFRAETRRRLAQSVADAAERAAVVLQRADGAFAAARRSAAVSAERREEIDAAAARRAFAACETRRAADRHAAEATRRAERETLQRQHAARRPSRADERRGDETGKAVRDAVRAATAAVRAMAAAMAEKPTAAFPSTCADRAAAVAAVVDDVRRRADALQTVRLECAARRDALTAAFAAAGRSAREKRAARERRDAAGDAARGVWARELREAVPPTGAAFGGEAAAASVADAAMAVAKGRLARSRRTQTTRRALLEGVASLQKGRAPSGRWSAVCAAFVGALREGDMVWAKRAEAAAESARLAEAREGLRRDAERFRRRRVELAETAERAREVLRHAAMEAPMWAAQQVVKST